MGRSVFISRKGMVPRILSAERQGVKKRKGTPLPDSGAGRHAETETQQGAWRETGRTGKPEKNLYPVYEKRAGSVADQR